MVMIILSLLLFCCSEARLCDSKKSLCTVRYEAQTRLQPVGCSLTTMISTTNTSMVTCGLSCSNNRSCAAFVYFNQNKTCYRCLGDRITNLTFNGVTAITLPIQFEDGNWNYTFPNKTTDRAMNAPVEIKAGTVVHLYGYYSNLSGFYLEFRQNENEDNVIFHFRPRIQGGTNIPVIDMTYCNKTVWGTETHIITNPYPFVVNKTFVLDILVSKVSYQVYINKTFCCSYKHVMPYENTKYLRVIGYVQVLDFRV